VQSHPLSSLPMYGRQQASIGSQRAPSPPFGAPFQSDPRLFASPPEPNAGYGASSAPSLTHSNPASIRPTPAFAPTPASAHLAAPAPIRSISPPAPPPAWVLTTMEEVIPCIRCVVRVQLLTNSFLARSFDRLIWRCSSPFSSTMRLIMRFPHPPFCSQISYFTMFVLFAAFAVLVGEAHD
jgi:hypothetical protein